MKSCCRWRIGYRLKRLLQRAGNGRDKEKKKKDVSGEKKNNEGMSVELIRRTKVRWLWPKSPAYK